MDSPVTWLASWLPIQRWYARKGNTPSLRVVSEIECDSGDARRVWISIVEDTATDPAVLYQVPLVHRDAGTTPDSAIVARLPDSTIIVDGAHDPAFTRALWNHVCAQTEPRPVSDGAARVLSGEQSNTSVIYDAAPMPVICKIFRQVHPGINPDIELQSALAASGVSAVPLTIGSMSGAWPSGDSELSGSLAFAQEFFPGVQDAWRTALMAASAGEDFTARAADLGETTARVNRTLADVLPTVSASEHTRALIRRMWDRRLAIALEEVPALQADRDRIVAVYDAVDAVSLPQLQRIHGDYHLGQVLDVPERGWVLLDFEGEPMRPISERRNPDLALRDVAGMLRSFDYIAGAVAESDPESALRAAAWAQQARAAFLAGYERVAGELTHDSEVLLTALEVDKAVYEAIYETRNRPTWSPLPLGAVRRLTGRFGVS